MLSNIFLISLTMSPVILILLFAVPRLRKHYGARWGYLAWLLIAIRLLIPFRLELPNAPVKLPSIPSYSVNMSRPKAPPVNTQKSVTPDISHDVTNVRKPADSSVSAEQIIYALWIVGMSVFILYHALTYLLFKKRVISESIRRGSFRRIPVYVCPLLSSPIMIGIIKPKIFLPDVKYTDDERNLILVHELTHFNRKDLIYKLLMLAANAVHWFNPLVYIMVNSAACELEYACDDDVIQGSGIDFRKDYSLTILKTTKK